MRQPPENGYIQFSFPFAPVSLQATSSRKEELKANVRAQLSAIEFLLSGDVSIEIQWNLHESIRYETDAAPDIDNVLKPLLDSICGPQGILVDDNQVQHVSCSWIDWTLFQQRLDITLRFASDLFVSKDGLVFVDFGNSLCFPVNRNNSPEALKALLHVVEMQLQVREQLRSLSSNYALGQGVMPIQRFFHRSRLTQFTVIPLDSFRTAFDTI
jgi:Holliday junction resolvase RusA-like endonuclease